MTRWKVLDSYGCELADMPTLTAAKEWCREGCGPFAGKRVPLVDVTNLGNGQYEVISYTGRFTIQRTSTAEADSASRRGVIRHPLHPWDGFTGERVGPMSTPVGDGYRVRLASGIECFVLPDEWVTS